MNGVFVPKWRVLADEVENGREGVSMSIWSPAVQSLMFGL